MDTSGKEERNKNTIIQRNQFFFFFTKQFHLQSDLLREKKMFEMKKEFVKENRIEVIVF